MCSERSCKLYCSNAKSHQHFLLSGSAIGLLKAMQGVEGERAQTRGKNIAHIQQRSTAWSKQGYGLFISPPEESQIMKFKAVCRADKTRKFKCRTSSSKSQCCPLGCHYSIEVGEVIKNKWMHTSQTVIAYLTLVSIIICFSKGVRHEFFDCPEVRGQAHCPDWSYQEVLCCEVDNTQQRNSSRILI